MENLKTLRSIIEVLEKRGLFRSFRSDMRGIKNKNNDGATYGTIVTRIAHTTKLIPHNMAV